MDTGQVTIRDAIRKQSRGPKWMILAPGILFGVASGFLRNRHSGVPADVGIVVLLGTGILFAAGLLIGTRLGRKTKCPKCSSPLGPFAYLMTDTSKRKKINYCPYCAVSLDEPMPQAETTTESVTTPEKLIWK